MILNIRIFIHVRHSLRRIQFEIASTLPRGMNNPQPKISRRDISLLKHMIFMFTMFIVGWLPTSIIHIADILHSVNALIEGIILLLGEVCLLSLVIYLLVYNHEIRQFLFNRIQRCCQR